MFGLNLENLFCNRTVACTNYADRFKPYVATIGSGMLV